MIHFYTSRHFQGKSFKILCTGKYEVLEQSEKYRISPIPRTVTTIPAKTTCPKCLDILIPREERKLETMKRARANHLPDQCNQHLFDAGIAP